MRELFWTPEAQEAVSRFWASYQPHEDEPSAQELAQIADAARQRAASAPPEPACVEWWSALPVAVQQKWLAKSNIPTLREAWRERCRRQKAVNFARASVGLEGFNPSPECEALAVRLINGEIEFSDVIETINEQAQRLR